MVDLAADLRPEDLAELKASCGLEPAQALVASLMVSTLAWVILEGEDPISVFGAGPDGEGLGSIWMRGSPRMDRPAAAMTICRQMARYLDIMHRSYPILWNFIDARNDKSMRWLEWGGFNVVQALPDHGPEHRLFYQFVRHQPPCATQ